MNLALAPTTLVTGWSPMVLVTTPPHPASKARRMLLSDSVGGAEDSRKGFWKSIPVKLTARLVDMWCSLRHPVHPCLPIPLRRHLLRPGPELDRTPARDVADAELRIVPPAEREWLPGHRHADVNPHHAGARALHEVPGDPAALGEHRCGVAVARGVL